MPSSTPTCKQHCLANGRTAHLFPRHPHNLSSSPTIKGWPSPDLQFVMTGRLWVKEDHLRLLLFLERVAAHCQKPSESGKPSCTETGAFEDIRERKTHFRPKQLITKYISDLKAEPWYLINPWFSRVQQTYTAVSKVLVLGKQCLRVQKSDFKKTLYFGEPKTSTFLQHFWATNFLSRFYNSRGGHLECSVFGNRLFYCMLVSSILTALMIPLLGLQWKYLIICYSLATLLSLTRC